MQVQQVKDGVVAWCRCREPGAIRRRDDVNLTGLAGTLQNFRKQLRMVRDEQGSFEASIDQRQPFGQFACHMLFNGSGSRRGMAGKACPQQGAVE